MMNKCGCLPGLTWLWQETDPFMIEFRLTTFRLQYQFGRALGCDNDNVQFCWSVQFLGVEETSAGAHMTLY